MLEPLGRFLALGPQACALGPAHLIHCLIQMAGDMESIQHVQSLAGLGRNDFQVGLPHVAAHKTQPFDGPRPQCLQAPPHCGLRPKLLSSRPSTCRSTQTAPLGRPPPPVPPGPAAVWPANAAVPPIANDGIRRRFGRSQSRSCLLSNRVPNESRPPRWIRPRAVGGAPSPTAQTIPLTDTPLPNWSGTLAPFPANSTVAPSALRTPSWRRSPGVCRRSTECARLRSHARHTPLAVARSKSRWRFPTKARRASAAGASSHSPAPVSDNANSACVCRHAALR